MDSRNVANMRYAKANYYRLPLLIPIEARDALKRCADEAGMSMNRYILTAVEEKTGLKLTLDKEKPVQLQGKGKGAV